MSTIQDSTCKGIHRVHIHLLNSLSMHAMSLNDYCGQNNQRCNFFTVFECMLIAQDLDIQSKKGLMGFENEVMFGLW